MFFYMPKKSKKNKINNDNTSDGEEINKPIYIVNK